MWLDFNPRASGPLYVQLVRAVKTAIAQGLLQPGEKLPSVRELATELAVNHNTVARAYQELEREKVIEVVVGRGTFISLHPVPSNWDERVEEIRSTIRLLLVESHHLGMTADQFVALVQDVVQSGL